MARAPWQTPRLTVLSRWADQERVLDACKGDDYFGENMIANGCILDECAGACNVQTTT